ncbi:DUF1289 domain-containing protein [Pokkaliibacter sp. CJK22405]|uniref:DUF1289 domain-containing protein n=1 Tax=Pokkaliibacter sp. CJK22405 TaxID=3384615 RepID=UPI00398483B7
MMTEAVSTNQNIESPCVGVCELNTNQICTGCWRSIDEISQWWNMSSAEKLNTLNCARNRYVEFNTGH